MNNCMYELPALCEYPHAQLIAGNADCAKSGLCQPGLAAGNLN
jgi:hypothetical protein